MRVVFYWDGLLSGDIFHRGGLLLGWSFIIRVGSQSGLSSGWPFIRVFFNWGGLLSGWSFIRIFFQQGGLSLGSSFTRVVSHQGLLSPGWSFIRVFFHQGGLSSGVPFYCTWCCDRQLLFLSFGLTEKALFQVTLGLLLVYAEWEKGGVCLRVCMCVCFTT